MADNAVAGSAQYPKPPDPSLRTRKLSFENTMNNIWNRTEDARSVSTLRALSLDQVQQAGVGHIGLPLGAAPIIHTVYSKFLVSDPAEPDWVNRDRFVLSAGHGSALLYSVLHLAGYGVQIDDLRDFRQWESITPGHPEVDMTPGVDATTGPLGQGLAMAVGMALAERMSAARLNTAEHTIIDHRTFALVSDGDLMEGVALEAAALAGQLRLGKLVAIYDDNDIVIDGRASETHSADGVCDALAALGWDVSAPVDGDDLTAIEAALSRGLACADKPSLVRVRTIIGTGSRLADTPKVHSGAVSEAEERYIKQQLGPDWAARFGVPEDVYAAWSRFATRGADARQRWEGAMKTCAEAAPESSERLRRWLSGAAEVPVEDLLENIPADPEPVRVSSCTVLNAIARDADQLVGGAADLASSIGVELHDESRFSPEVPTGRNIVFGIREHAMAAISNGVALHGLLRPFVGTFAAFTTYLAPALRMAALQKLPSVYILSHDSITVGEDGPTHQPIEVLSFLRALPNTLVLRPADFTEAVHAWKLAIDNCTGPTVILVSRTPVPQLDHGDQEGSPLLGGYVIRPVSEPDLVIAASGSEVHIAIQAAEDLQRQGIDVAVASMPSHELFMAQSAEYRDTVLQPTVPRLIVEASHPLSLWRLAGALGKVYGIDRFGASAPPAVMLEKYGFTRSHLAQAARDHLALIEER